MKVTIRAGRGGKYREILLPGEEVKVGRSRLNDLVLPFPWVKDEHLIVVQDAGIARARTVDGTAEASLGGRTISTSGVMLPQGGTIQIPSPDGVPLSLTFTFKCANKGVLLEDVGPGVAAGTTTPEFVAVDPLVEQVGLFATSTAVPAPKGVVVPRRTRSVEMTIALALLAVVVLIGGAFGFKTVGESRKASQLRSEIVGVEEAVKRADGMIRAGQYAEAKAVIDEATRIAGGREVFAPEIHRLRVMSEKPEIKFGSVGYLLMEGQWLPPETARAWKSARDRDDPKIGSLAEAATNALAMGGDLEEARRKCEEALALIAARPVHPHPMQDRIRELRDDIKNQLVAAEMTAKGFVLYDRKWVTPAEKYRLEQLAKGLVERKGRWVTKEEAFAAEQTEKGLVFHNGKWMTPDERQVARGLVKFEGGWVKPEEKTRILAVRAQAEEAERKRMDEERRQALALTERRRQEQAVIESRYPDAYAMSKEFVKDILKSPTSAQFLEYGDPKVTVIYKDGWYSVLAVVDARNGFGAMLRSRYLCKLRPAGGNKWEAENTILVD